MKAREEKVNKNQTEGTTREKKTASNSNNNVNESTWHNANETNENSREKEVYTRWSIKILETSLTHHHSLSAILFFFFSVHFIVCLHLRFSDAFFTALSHCPSPVQFTPIILVCLCGRATVRTNQKAKSTKFNDSWSNNTVRSVCMR